MLSFQTPLYLKSSNFGGPVVYCQEDNFIILSTEYTQNFTWSTCAWSTGSGFVQFKESEEGVDIS